MGSDVMDMDARPVEYTVPIEETSLSIHVAVNRPGGGNPGEVYQDAQWIWSVRRGDDMIIAGEALNAGAAMHEMVAVKIAGFLVEEFDDLTVAERAHLLVYFKGVEILLAVDGSVLVDGTEVDDNVFNAWLIFMARFWGFTPSVYRPDRVTQIQESASRGNADDQAWLVVEAALAVDWINESGTTAVVRDQKLVIS